MRRQCVIITGTVLSCISLQISRMSTYPHEMPVNSSSPFQVALLNRTIVIEDPEEHVRGLIRAHFRPVVRAVLVGIAGNAPTSTAQNLVDLLMALVSRSLEECRVWIPGILFSVRKHFEINGINR